MSEIIIFKPKHEQNYAANLNDFIAFSRDSLNKFEDIDEWSWERNAWPKVGAFIKHGNNGVNFKNEHKQNESVWLTQPFRDFAKGYVRYYAITQKDTPARLAQLFMPLKALEAALLKVHQISDVTKLDIIVLDQAAEEIRSYTNSGTNRADTGRRLRDLADFISDKQISKKVTWQSPFPSVKRSNSRLDKKSKKKTADKLPSSDALDALAEMFANNPQNSSDKVTLAYCGILLCAPGRIGEIQNLHKLCIHKEEDSEGKMQVGFRWHASKNGGSDIKYVPTAMQDVAIQSVKILAEVSDKGRELAKWLEDTNGKFYRPESMRDIPDDQPLTIEQRAKLFNTKSKTFTKQRMYPGRCDQSVEFSRVQIKVRHKAYVLHDKIAEKGCITFADLDELSRSLLPKGFPYVNRESGLKYSDALTTMRFGEMDSKIARPYQLYEGDVKKLVADRLTFRQGRKSIFERHGYKDSNGSYLFIKSHQFRHWLNDLARKGGVSEIDIARWSGRANIHQNNVYNHMSYEDHIENMKSSGLAVADNLVPLAKIKANDPNMPVTLADLEAATYNADKVAHITEWGFCVHNFVVSPCQNCADCLNCTKQVCIKGDSERLSRLKRQKNLLLEQLDKSVRASKEGTFNADRWAVHQQGTIDRVEGLIAILESDDIPEGAIVRLSNEYQDSPVKRSLCGESTKSAISTPDDIHLDDMKKLLQGT